MSENSSTNGQTQTQPKRGKKSSPASEPSAQSLAKSPLPHKQTLAPTENAVKSPSDKVAEAAALLRGEPKKQPDTEPAPASAGSEERVDPIRSTDLLGDGPDPEPAPTPVAGSALPETFDPKFLAEQLGIKPAELYEKLQITTQEGETVTFGEWKDRVTDQQSATRAQIERETQLDQRESAMLERLQLLQGVDANIRQQFPEADAALAQFGNQIKAQERQAALTAMPELQDKATRDQFRDDIANHLQPFGFRPSEINVMDHRILLALKDAISTKQRLDKLMSFEPDDPLPRTQRPQGKRKRVSNRDKLIASAKSGSTSDKVAAAGAILRGTN